MPVRKSPARRFLNLRKTNQTWFWVVVIFTFGLIFVVIGVMTLLSLLLFRYPPPVPRVRERILRQMSSVIERQRAMEDAGVHTEREKQEYANLSAQLGRLNILSEIRIPAIN